MSLEQQYYEVLTRNDHPVFRKIFDDVTTFDQDTPFNAVLNLIVAKQLVKVRAAIDELNDNKQPDTTRASGIDQWEETLFGFTKTQVSFTQRRDELVQRRNERIGMDVGAVITEAESITGQTPIVIRNLFASGWVLDTDLSILDLTTVFSSDNQASDSQLYLVVFSDPVDSDLLAKLDERLTLIEKAGSRHIVEAPFKFWILDESILDIDTLLG